MDIEAVMRERRSIRGFLDKPIPRDLLEEIIALANRAPSSMNTQPWHLHVLTGEPLERVRKGNTERMLAGVPPSREIGVHVHVVDLFDARLGVGVIREDAYLAAVVRLGLVAALVQRHRQQRRSDLLAG